MPVIDLWFDGDALGREFSPIEPEHWPFDPQSENHIAVISEVCHWIEDHVSAIFVFSVGDVALSLDIWYDLNVFLCDLPATLAWIDGLYWAEPEHRSTAHIDLWAPGTEIVVHLTHVEGRVRTCLANAPHVEGRGRTSLNDGRMAEDEVTLEELDGSLTRVLLRFFLLAGLAGRHLLASPVFDGWRDHPSVQARLSGRPFRLN